MLFVVFKSGSANVYSVVYHTHSQWYRAVAPSEWEQPFYSIVVAVVSYGDGVVRETQ